MITIIMATMIITMLIMMMIIKKNYNNRYNNNENNNTNSVSRKTIYINKKASHKDLFLKHLFSSS